MAEPAGPRRRARLRKVLLVLILGLVGGYVGLAALAFALQRRLVFPAPAVTRAPGFEGATLLRIPKEGGRDVFALHLPAPPGGMTVAHFHGNGEDLADAELLARALRREGLGFFGVEYPGYGLMRDQAVSEAAIFESAEAALRYLHGQLGVPPERVVLEGLSLGTGVATEMALRGHGAKLVLLAPYTSIADVAADVLPFLPARLLVRDRFDTRARAPRVEIPVLVVHGERDAIVPASMGRELAPLFPDARLVIVEGAGHGDLFARRDPSVARLVAAFAREP